MSQETSRQSSGRQPFPRALGLGAVILAVAGLAGCAWLGLGKKPADKLKFWHAKHARHIRECEACHWSAKTKTVVMARHAACVTCHEAADDERPADKACLQCHYTLTPRRAEHGDRPNYASTKFDHENHAELDCAACHGAVNSKLRPTLKIPHPDMEDCLACHFPKLEHPSFAPCGLCHEDLTAQLEPENHRAPSWKIMHGLVSYERHDLCERCHEPSNSCEECHSREWPQSHTAVFRSQMHGFQAMSRPTSCETCHRQDFCIACHQTAEPRNHTETFKDAPLYAHCGGCHLPLEEGNRCAVCHEGDPHATVDATPPPATLIEFGLIKRDEPCIGCHPVSLVPETHVYHTTSQLECVLCHRF